jgi:hypothetical protein
MGKFDKKEVCEYCEEKMDAVYRNKRFCSPRCRVYWNRENKTPAQVLPPLPKTKDESKIELTGWEKLRNKRLGINK